MKRAVLLAVLALGACATPGAPLAPPVAGAPPAWTLAQVSPAATANQAWWVGAFHDTALAALVDEAGAALSVDVAESRREAAEARLGAAQSALLPSLTLGLNGGGRADDLDTVGFVGAELSAAFSRNLGGAEALRVGSAEAALAAAEASVAAARLDARTLAGRLIAASLSAQAQEAAARRSLAAAEESLALATTRTGAGLDNALAVAQARTARDRAAGLLPPLAQARTQARLGLEALLGRPAGSLAPLLEGPPQGFTTRAMPQLLDTPAGVLARRPDVRLALARLAEADFAAAAAQADRWPTLSIGAALGLTGASEGADGAALSLTGALLQPLFDGGRREALADAAAAEAQAARTAYAEALNAAAGDVETAFNRLRQTGFARDAQAAAVASAIEEVRLARARYTSGLTNFRDVTAADSALAAAEAELARAEGAVLEAQVLLAASLALGADM
jgi:outer membrane protein TolC